MSRQRRGNELGVLLLLYELGNAGFTHIPPATLGAVAGQALLYSGYIPVSWERWEVCLSAESVLYKKDYKRLLLSAIEHGDDMHLYYNMISLLWKGRGLETRLFGSKNFALFLILASVLCSATYVGLAFALFRLLNDYSYLKTCAIGFSGVLFTLKTLTSSRDAELNENGRQSFMGGYVRVPLRYAAWAELILIHILVPGSSFLGHLSGILVGMAYIYTPLGNMIDRLLQTITGEPVYRWAYIRGYT
ncbi:hypothetical protein J437_LFUL011759 [Ladona fulva]|uniref:Peptidase S54 rhomboid domain-containing protein n=1 Tax=Ladona fulva TaxID=123851 RepID=A0A8K0KD80_LADFU|nr:hypothetical protein J437_LFUL011759 [Ladona fulva]